MKQVASKFGEERKAKAPKDYLYMLVVQFRQDKNGSVIKNDATQMPEYDLKVMRLPAKRSEKILKTVENTGIDFEGAEILFDYPDTDDIRHLYSDAVTVPIVRGTNNSIISKFKGLEEKILAEAANFKWDGIEKSFPEWKGMTSDEATAVCNSMFKKFDEYKTALAENPNAKYMEYLNSNISSVPELGVSSEAKVEVPKAPEIPKVDVNSAFGGIGTL
jgi:hypothetical protein